MDNSPTKGRVIGMQQHTRIRMYACNQITTYMHRSGSPPLRLCTYTSIVGLTNNGSKDIPSTGASVQKKKKGKKEKRQKNGGNDDVGSGRDEEEAVKEEGLLASRGPLSIMGRPGIIFATL